VARRTGYEIQPAPGEAIHFRAVHLRAAGGVALPVGVGLYLVLRGENAAADAGSAGTLHGDFDDMVMYLEIPPGLDSAQIDPLGGNSGGDLATNTHRCRRANQGREGVLGKGNCGFAVHQKFHESVAGWRRLTGLAAFVSMAGQ
jgi:hypothetical protein